MWSGYKNYDHYFSVDQRLEWLTEAMNPGVEIIGTKTKYYNIAASFDIETSSYYENHEKKATMYCWAFCLNGSTLFGRTWDEWVDTINFISYNLETQKIHLIIYVHNLGYEFQWMRNWLDFEKVFAVKERRPVYANLSNGIEFKCSYLLSNYALAYIGDNLITKYKVQKDTGAVDYSIVRHSATPLSDEEIWYNIHDVQVVTSYIQEKIENENGITSIPLTNTGYVRQYCRNCCFEAFNKDPKAIKKFRAKYHELMRSLRITSKCEYDQLHEAFAGGYVHAAPTYSGLTLSDVSSDDETSAYPGAMVSEKFPMGRSTFIGDCDIEDIRWLTKEDNYRFLFTVKLVDVTPKFIYENYISVSKCLSISKDAVINNGRVAAASELTITITDIDWEIIEKCYDFDLEKCKFYNLRFYPAGYLPKPLILAILNLYKNKTSLKGVVEKYIEYMVSKNMINAAYGMMVTAIIRDIFEYDGEWDTTPADAEEQLNAYNNNYNRFQFYAWGVWVTAFARRNVWEAIFEFAEDYVYADTDSVKGLNRDKHDSFFTIYNANMEYKLRKMCRYYDIPYDLCSPKTIKGVSKTIGVWDREPNYKTFKTIGAKRYIYEYENGELSFTVSGVNKKYGVPYLLKKYTFGKFDNPESEALFKLAYNPPSHKKAESKEAMNKILELHNSGKLNYAYIFDRFNEGLYFPPAYTGKQTLTYSDNPIISTCIDYLGQPKVIYEKSFIHMEPQYYYLSPTEDYKRFLAGYRDASL